MGWWGGAGTVMEEVNGGGPINPVVVSPPSHTKISQLPRYLSKHSLQIPFQNPPAARPSPLASVELCKGLAQIRLIPPCSNPQGPRKTAPALPAPA